MKPTAEASKIAKSAASVAPTSRRRRKRKHVSNSPLKPHSDIQLSDSKSKPGGLPDADQPAVDQPDIDQPDIDRPEVDQPAIDQPDVDQPAIDQPVDDQLSTLGDRPEVDQPAIDQPAIDQPAIDQPAIDQPAIDQPAIDQPDVDQPESKPEPETTSIEEKYDMPPMAKEHERIEGLEHGDKILRWLGGSMGKNPLDPGQALREEWPLMLREVPKMSRFFRPKCCSWNDLSEAHRKWFATWIPESQARLEVGSVRFWATVIIRLLWEQLLAPDRPDDLWLGPHWTAFGKVESELRVFEEDGHREEPLFKHSSQLYRNARWQYYRFFYTLHGIHKDVRLLKQRVFDAVSPVIVDDEQRLAEMDTCLTTLLDSCLTTLLDSFIQFDLRIHSSAEDIRFDWSDPETGRSTGFIWREDNKLMKMGSFIDEATEWPVSYISRPLGRAYGEGHIDGDGEFIKRPEVGDYHELNWYEPMKVHGMPGDSKRAFDKEVHEKDVAEKNMLEEDSEEKEVEKVSDEDPKKNSGEEDSQEEKDSEDDTRDYIPDKDMSQEQKPGQTSNEMPKGRQTRSMSRATRGQ